MRNTVKSTWNTAIGGTCIISDMAGPKREGETRNTVETKDVESTWNTPIGGKCIISDMAEPKRRMRTTTMVKLRSVRESNAIAIARSNSMASGGCIPVPWHHNHRRQTMAERVEAAAVDMADEGSNSFTLGVSENARPEHLVILVNGIAGSAENWRFAAEQFKRKLADKVVVHCSASNSALRTFNGVDIMGNRLAEEVQDVIKDTPGVTKISFLSHSLGGLIARYAIGQLYAPPGGRSLLQERLGLISHSGENSATDREAEGSGREDDENTAPLESHSRATMAGLEPLNFITVATPHLGSRGNQHLPFLFGISTLEKVAPHISHLFVGRTGRHLFLADDKTNQPLLQRMTTDCKEGRFISALQSFKQRTAYGNIVYDHMVGWRTATIRRKSEMPQALHEALDSRYPHIVREEEQSIVVEDASLESSSGQSKKHAADPIEEEMLAGLQQVPWRRVDVSFLGAKAKYQAHNTIQVKTESSHSEGADVIAHILDKHF